MSRIIFSIEIIILLFVRELLIPISPLERILKFWLIFAGCLANATTMHFNRVVVLASVQPRNNIM